MSFFEETEKLTIDLVNIPSVTNSEGERRVAEKILEYINGIEYFKKHKEFVWGVPIEGDKYGRMNVFALLKGKKGDYKNTIILHGHIDTVGVEDYGDLSSYAFDPVTLKEKLHKIALSKDVKKDLESGDWMFGRGANDMKSGVAAHLVTLKELSKLEDKLEGNILFMANPGEETQHTGMINSLDMLEKLKREHGLEYMVAINNDYTSPLYEGDTNRYIYTGTVGKLLPSFYIYGSETHVGQCFEGLDPNLIAAELIKEINYNTDLCDEYNNEYTVPPIALKLKDLKTEYNVQTPLVSYVYFNYMIHSIAIEKVMELLFGIAERCFKNVLEHLDEEYRSYCKKVNLEYKKLPWVPKVTTYTELYERVKNKLGDKLDEEIRQIIDNMLQEDADSREIALNVVNKVRELSEDKEPEIVFFFSPPYCPHSTIRATDEAENILLNEIKVSVNGFVRDENIPEFKILQFFPSLSDSSYLKIQDNRESIETLIKNMPDWGKAYSIPVDKIKNLSIPAVNFGIYGKDAHKWTERVYKPYSFEILPKLLIHVIKELL
ncbi:M20/M25/M40 family metallo-hydrolase [Clostridium oryzae]|uniref:Succinyl-diaminopimelate desuccinylase n=1 Tax=Clostridium oryzae TaxID=1450648 RepID=A0A1V4IHB1_9CLOT|nr:M20/M25/M40 family metallo-hydrolase [Clostridium oryzae]OPJ59343.1 succinyl-diaminopimelate desuccinylase [Clostridium oryzae]